MRKFQNVVVPSLTAIFCLFSTVFAVAQTSLSATVVHFGFVALNEKSAIQTVKLFNNQSSVLGITSLVVSGNGFALDPSTACGNPGTLAAHASCTIALTLTPAATGVQTGSLVITTNAANSPQTVTLTGTEIAPTTLSTSALQFAFVGQNETSPILTTTLTNHQLTALHISSLGISGTGFALDPSTTCANPGTLAAGATCTIAATFTPSGTGTQLGTVTISTDASNSPQMVSLSGTGVVPTTLSANGVPFGFVALNQTSAVQTVTLINNQSTPLGIVSLVVSGPGFALDPSTTCANPGSLAGRTSCVIGLTFKPTTPGMQTGSLVIKTNASNSPQTVTLTGTEIGTTTLSASAVNFAFVSVNQPSAIQQITLSNHQSATLHISSLVVSGTGFALDPSTTCANPGTLAAGANCTLAFTFTPAGLGPEMGSATVNSDASNSPQTITLNGTGVVPTTLSANALQFGMVALSQISAIQTVTLMNNQSSALGITSLGVSGTGFALDPSTTCANPGSLAGRASCTIALTFTPAALGTQSGALTITTNANNSPQTVTLKATGVAPVSLGPPSVGFGSVAVGTTSVTKTVTLTNNQSASLSINMAVFGGPFALDTSAVTTCPQAGGTVSGTLAGGASCTIGIDFQPTAIGPTAGGQITLIDNASNSPQFVALSGSGVAQVTVSPSTLAFGNVAVNTTSAAMNVTLTNNQTLALNFPAAITAAAPYAVVPATTTCVTGTPVAPGGSCTISLTYTPTAMGAAPASTLSIADDAPGSPQVVNLTGTGVGAVTLSPTTLGFGTVVVNEAVVKNVTLKNNQSVPLTISSITGFAGGYTESTANTTCPLAPATVPANSSCVIAVSLTATAIGAQPGTISVNDNAPTSPQMFSMTANAIQPVMLSPISLSFTAQFVGATSPAQTVMLTNEQAGVLTISSATVTGTNSSDFTVAATTCPTTPATLSASSNCSLSVTFTPTASGTRKATLTIVDDALGSPQTVALIGSGNAPVTLSPPTYTSFTAPVGTTSAYKTFTITNAQTAATLHFTNLKLIGDFIQSATTCPIGGAGLASGAACTLSVQFDPSIGGTRDGQLQVYDDALTSPQVANLSGVGTSPLTISPVGLSFSAQTVGTTSAAKTITLTNHETQPETFTLTPTGDYTANSNCATGVIAAKSSCLIYINFVPSSVTPTTRTGSLSITHTAAIGSPITVSLTGSATATNPPAAVSVVSPGAGAAGTLVNVTITGNGWTHFSPSSVISFSDINSGTYAVDITVQSFTAPNPNTILATLQLTANTVANPVTYGARNIKIVTPLSGGGSETASLISAFIIADPNNQHTITSVSPAFGTQGQTLNVALTATGTNFVQGTTYANFGDGITINSLTILDATDAQANISISNTTPIGYRTITLVTGSEFATSVLSAQNNPIFQIGPNSAALLSISPNSAPQGNSLPVTITASGTHFLQNATQISFTGGILSPEVTVTSPTTATAQLAVPANATIGLQNATVSTGGEIATLNNAFTVTGATPYLISVAPSSGVQGQTLDVILTGNAYTTFPVGVYSPPFNGSMIANFTGEITVNKITVSAANSVDVNITISPSANVGGITASITQNPSGAASIFQFGFSVRPSSAAITSVTPSCVPQGGQLTLAVTGLNTLWVQGTTTAAFYPVPVPAPSFDEITITDATDALLNVAVPTNTPPGAYGFYMATGGQVVSASMNVCAATPTLTMNPANGLLPSGSSVNSFSVSFTGQFTKWGPGTLPVISGEGVTLTGFNVTGTTSATGTINIVGGTNGTPTATGLRLVTFTTGGEIDTTYFNVTQTPVGIISVSPYHAAQSVTLDVAITGLNTHFVAGTTQVLFGPQITVNSVHVTDATHLTVNITTSYLAGSVPTPTPAGWDAVYVNTGAEQLICGFLIDSPAMPSLVSVVPGSAQQGASVDVTITGSLTNWVQNTTEAILGAGVSVSNLTITSPTTATATIQVFPTAPVGGNSVIMITGTQVVSGTGFSVTPNAAEIVSVGPAVNCNANGFNIADFCGVSGGSGTPYVVSQLQTATLNIAGVGTHWLQGETTVNFGPGVAIDALTVSSPTTAQVQITVLSTSPVGYAPLTTITGGEVVTLQQAIDIEEGFPTMLATAPSAAPQNDTFNLQVLGRFTNWGPTTSAAFNQDITVNSVNVIDSDNLILNVTVSPWAYVDFGSPCGHVLTVTTGTVQVVGNSTAAGEPGIFCVTQGAEEITSVSPLETIQGSTVSVNITGSATNFLAGVTQVSFGDSNFAVGEITVNSPTSLTVPVAVSTSATPGFKTVTVTTYGQVASQQYSFTVSPGVGTLNEAIPNQAEQGAPLSGQPPLVIRLLGQYTHFDASSTATFGAGITVQSITPISTTEVDATITIDPLSYTGGRSVTVTTPGLSCALQPPTANFVGCAPGATTGTGSEIVTANVFSIIPGPAIISNVSPATGNEGQEVIVNITGEFTHWAQNFTQFYIAGGGYDITINSVVINSPTSATVDLSISPTANPGARSIYMVTNGESLTDSGAFVVTGGVPVITYLYPNSAQPGTNSLKVTVHGLYTLWAAGSTTVNFGPGITIVAGSFQVDDTTHLEALINIDPAAQLGYRTVQVTTTGLPAGTQVLTGNFLVQAPPPPPTPYIWYENPSSGIPGQTLTINFSGANTQWNPGAGEACSQSGTTITGFNAAVTVDCFQVTSETSAYATVTISPTATASFSDLTLTTTGTTNNPSTEVDTAGFSVVVAQPTLSVVDPGSGMEGSQNLIVNIIGQFTDFDNTTTFSFGPGITVNGPPTILGPTIATQSISIDQLATTGGRSVVSTTTDAPAGQQVVGGAGFSVTPSLALISAVTPNTALQGTTITVEVTGQNTHWNGSTTFQFGAGIVVTSKTVNSNTDATLTLALPALAPLGPTWVNATTLGEVATLNNGFVVQAGTPLLLSSGPGSEPQQGSAVFTILSQATQWTAANPPTVSYGPGIDLTNVNVTGPTSMTVDGYVEPTTSVGWRNLTVTTGSQILGLNNAVYVSPGPAVINSVSPSTGGQGANLPSVTITGTNTHWLQGTTTLSFPDVLINSWSVTSPNTISANITVNASAPAGQISVTATTLGEVATGTNVFTITQTQPELLAVVASSAVQGWTGTVTLTGQYTHFATTGCTPNCSVANFGSGITVNSVTALSATSLQANITVQPTTTLGTRNVSVTTGTEIVSLNNAFTVTVGPAAIVAALAPASGPQGASNFSVAIVGSQTHWTSSGPTPTTASFGGGINVTGLTITDLTHATATISIPNTTTLGAYNVSLTTGGEVATQLGAFTVTVGSPYLSAVNPPTGNQGANNLSVTLTGQFTHFNTAAGCSPCSVANFGSGIAVVSTTASDATHAVAVINISPTATIASRTVSVVTGSETATITGGFSVLAGIPQLVSANQNFAQAGTTANIVITGEFTTFQAGFLTVSFGSGITVNFISNVTLTQLTANITVASNATVGSRDITVTANGTPLTLSGGFNVTAGTPAITQISPNFGNPGATNLTVTITGQYTNWTAASTVTIGTASSLISVGGAPAGTPGPVVSATATSVTVSISIGPAAPLGPADVTVTTGAVGIPVPGGFTVQAAVIPAPSLISLSPGVAAGGAVPINSNFIAVFSQPMNRTTFTNSGTSGTVVLYLTSNPGGWVQIPVSLSVDATGRVLTITPNALLAVNSTYYLEMTSGIKDATAAGNSFGGFDQYLYTEFSANTTAPTVVATNPLNGTTGVGTNVPIQIEFSTAMNQETQTGVTVSSTGGNVAGTISWNANPYCCGTGWAGPGNILTFTPTTPLAANTSYTVSWGTPLADTAGNAVTPGSFTFITGSGADTASNYTGSDIVSGQTNVGTNIAPMVTFSKPINPLDVNTSTLLMYNADSGKYINGTVTVAPNGLSATFTPAYQLLPDTYYRIHMSWGNYDMDGNYLYGIDTYFTTGNGSDLVAPQVASISPAPGAIGIPLNAQVVVHFSSPVDPNTVSNAIQLTPSVAGTTTLSSDLVTLTFVPTTELAPATSYSVSVNSVTDIVGNAVTFSGSTFTTATSIAPLNVSTGFNASGQLITTNNTADANWVVYTTGITTTPSESTFGSPSLGAAQPLQTVGTGDAGFYGGWPVNGPSSDWININPNSVTGNTFGLYYTTFNITGASVPSNLCLVGAMGVDDNGMLAINGNPITGNISAIYGLTPLNVSIPQSDLVLGSNTLALGWGSTDNNDEAFRLQGSIQTCGASFTGGLTLQSAIPAYAASGQVTNTTITLNFNNALDPATVNNNTLPVMINWNSYNQISGSYQVNGTQVIFTPDSPFPVNSTIWVGAVNGPYDMAGDSASNGSNYTQLTYFTTGGTVIAPSAAFKVMAFTPAANATNVGLNAPVVATFNRSVSPNSINSSDFGLFNGDSQSPWCTSYSRSQDNATIAFNCGTMPSSATMTAILHSGLTDWSGNALTNFTSQFTTNYYDSNTNGSVISERPGNGASGVNANLPIVLYTNLPINASSANAGFEVAQNNVAVPGTVNVQDGGYTLVFTPSVPWTPGALIQWWTTGNLTDTTYNTNFNGASGYFYVAASTSTLTPAVQVASPQAYTNPVPINTIFDLQFNTPLNAATVTASNIYLYDSSTGLNPAVTYSQPQPNEVRMVPTSSLPANHYIYVEINSGLQSTTSVPAASNSWWEYTGTTADTTLPTVTSAVPYNGASGVGVNVTPGVIFSKAIDPVSVNNNTFQVTNAGTPLAGGFWFNSGDTRVEFVPNAPLPANTNLTMSLNGVLDTIGNPVTFSSSFQTGALPDTTAPTVQWTSVSSSESIPTNSAITVQFSESMDATTFTNGQPGNCGNFYISDQLSGDGIGCIPTTLTWNATQTVAYLAPNSPLAAGRQYYLAINGGTDLAGNQVQGYGTYFYAEFGSSSTAPTVINFNPLTGATGLGTNAVIEAQFSGPIDPNFLTGVTLSGGGGTVTTSPSLSAANTILQLIPSAPLEPNTSYLMTIAGVRDPAGNAVATVTNSFQTGATYDISSPSWLYGSPMNNTTVGTNTVMKLGFNKPLNPITVNSSTFQMYLNDTGQWIPTTIALSPNATEVTMTPQIPLLPNTEYYFRACCNYQDEDGNNGNYGTNYFWTSGGAVTTGPTVSVSPVNGSTGIPLNAEVIVSVSTVVDFTSVSSTSVQLLDASNTPVAGTLNFSLTTDRQTFTFVPTAALLPATTYTVKVSGFTDQNGNLVVPSTTTFTTGSTTSTGGLSFTSSNITWGSTVTNNLQQICMTFSQILDPKTVNSSTLKVMNGWNSNLGLAGTYAVGGTCGVVPVGSNTVVFTPASPYPAGASIYVGECGGPTDILGEVFQNGNCYAQQLVYFIMSTATPDTTYLQVVSVSPASGATNVGRDQAVSVTFNKSVSPGSTGGYNTQLFAGQSLQTNGSVTMSADGRTMTFNVGALYNGTTYTIAIPTGGVTDMSGNGLQNNFVSSFTTTTDPATGNGSVQSSNPGNTSGVPTDSLLTLYMNRQVNPSTLPGQLTVAVNGQVYAGNVQATASNWEIQFTPTVPFPNSATVQWFLSGSVLDVYGNPFNGTSGYFYTAAAAPNPATAQPQVIAVSPGMGTTLMPTNGEVDIEYSQPIDATTLSGNVYINSGPATPFTLSLPSPNVVRITPNTPWTASTWYGFCTNTSVKGTNGVAAQSDCWADYFTTTTSTDTTSGTVTIGPPNSTVNVGTNAYIRLQFSKPADRTTINSTNVAITTGGNPIPGSWSYNYSSNDLVGANFSPENPLPPSTQMKVSVSGLLDYAGNSFNEPTAQFTTAAAPDYTHPSVTMDFGYNQTGVATNASFTCSYTEPMDPSSITPGGTYVYSYVTNTSIPVTYTFASNLMSVTMTPASPLLANSEYNYQCNNAIDLTGNSQNNNWVYFYTGNGPSNAGPVLLQTNPPNGFTNIPLNNIGGPWTSVLGFLFNEPVASESLANITLTPNGGSPLPIGVVPEWGNTIAVVDLPWALLPNTQYTYNLTGVTDLNGNPMTPTTSTFTTGSSYDYTNPTATTATPTNGTTTTDNNPTISVTFSYAMDPVLISSSQIYLRTHNTQTTIPTTLSISADYKTVTLTPTTPLAGATIYDLVYWPNNWYLVDIAGNPNYQYGDETTFTTGPATVVNGACGSANSGSFSAPPTANLCSAGTASGQSNASGTFNWTCKGQNGGSNASCSATVTPPNACYPQSSLPASSLVSWWKGDDDATDHMGNNNGTLENGAGFAVGEVNDAFSFNGSNQYVLIGEPVPADLQIQNNITLSAWVYMTSYPANGSYYTIVGSENSSYAGVGLYIFGGSNNGNGRPPGSLDLDIGNGSSWYSAYTTSQLPLNQWVLVTTVSSANQPDQFYFNGVLQPYLGQSGEAIWNGTVSYSGTWFAIGQSVSANWPFIGLMDEVQVYNAALSAAQVQGIYNAGSAGVCP
jgi:hypothetical protein